MKNLLCVSIIAIGLIFSSCSPAIVKNFSRQDTQTLSRNDFYPVFDHQTQTLVYNLQIDFKKHHFSGLLVLQPQANDTYRAVFTSHFGLKIFDFELSKSLFTVHYCIEGLNKKLVIDTFKKDFLTYFLFDLPDSEIPVTVYTNRNENQFVYKTKVTNKKAFYKVDKTQKQTIEIQRKIAGKTLFSIEPGKEIPQKVSIHHKFIGLRLTMDKLQ